ncbi:flavin reductase [Rhizobium sp. RU36D]|uniref:flavin reductase n=1 Tax=Rhizobium sp. RU36D TaxID=1907415 RepID=UPI0009D843A5|nr:flavin reductase [Rhizobium sp. RU36D]SMC58326.1 flavin reductase [Rhizobium sp. RU36D]
MDQPHIKPAEPAITASADKVEFRDAMAQLCAGVSIITTDGSAGRAGCTATAVCSVSDDPPTLLVCLNRSSRNNSVIRANGRLCVNILAAEQEPLARSFADATLSMDERFARASWRQDLQQSPALSGATASLDCDIDATEEIGSHSVFFCRIRHIEKGETRSGLAYFNRAFHKLGNG